MDASVDKDGTFKIGALGRFTRISVQSPAGEIEARLSDMGNWELRVRRDEDDVWRLACRGDVSCGALTTHPVVRASDETKQLGALTIEPSQRRVRVADSDVPISRKEFALLLALASEPDRVFTKAELYKAIWDDEGTTRTRTLDSHASRLRNRLRAAGADGLIINCWGVGYRFWDRVDLTSLPPSIAGSGR
jgi:DNA-binding response OmpR family regulator